MESIWQPVRESGNLVDRIVTKIEDLINSARLSEGEKLPPERELAKMLGVSRPVLREAVKTLSANGRLLVKHGQGVFVATNQEQLVRDHLRNLEISLLELFRVREVLEVTAAQWAAVAITESEIERLGELMEQQELAYAEPVNFEQLKRLDIAFHSEIVAIARNRFLTHTYAVLQEMINEGMETTLTVPGRLAISRTDHRNIFNAIIDHDPERAALASRVHISGAQRTAISRIQGSVTELITETDSRSDPVSG